MQQILVNISWKKSFFIHVCNSTTSTLQNVAITRAEKTPKVEKPPKILAKVYKPIH